MSWREGVPCGSVVVFLLSVLSVDRDLLVLLLFVGSAGGALDVISVDVIV
jgi:hypothetical protein